MLKFISTVLVILLFLCGGFAQDSNLGLSRSPVSILDLPSNINFLKNSNDSLIHFRNSFFYCTEILEKVQKEKTELNILYIESQLKLSHLQRQLFYSMESDKINQNVNLTLEKQLKVEKRKNRVWRTVALTAIGTTILSTTLILLK